MHKPTSWAGVNFGTLAVFPSLGERSKIATPIAQNAFRRAGYVPFGAAPLSWNGQIFRSRAPTARNGPLIVELH